MSDLGIATVELKITKIDPNSSKNDIYLPNVMKNPRVATMDVTVKDILPYIQNDPQKSAKGTEVKTISDGYSLLTPASRLVPIGNYVEGTADAANMTNPHISWKVIPGAPTEQMMGKDLFNIVKSNLGAAALSKKVQVLPKDVTASYKGAVWKTTGLPKHAAANDITDSFGKVVAVSTGSSSFDNSQVPWATQAASGTDIWWAVETQDVNPDGVDRMPFCIYFSPKQQASSESEVFFAIRINPEGTWGSSGGENGSNGAKLSEGSFDIVFIQGQSPTLYDWGVAEDTAAPSGSTGTTTPAVFSPRKVSMEFVTPGAGGTSGVIWNSLNTIVVRALGSGIIHAEIRETGQEYVYRRYSSEKKEEVSTSSGTATKNTEVLLHAFKMVIRNMRLIGTCCEASMNVSPVCFAEADFGLNSPAAPDKDGKLVNPYTITELPLEQTSTQNAHGNNARTFDGQTAKMSTLDPTVVSGEGRYGQAKTSLVTSPTQAENKVYRVGMVADSAQFGVGGEKMPVLAPTFHRVKGTYKSDDKAGGDPQLDISDHLISFSESFNLEELNLISHSMDLTLYDEGGDLDYLLTKSSPVRIKAGWQGLPTDHMFTGLTVGGSRSEVAGKETLNIHCEDYMFLLGSMMMLNSPYYDGMDAFTAIADLASRVGITAIDDCNKTLRFFLGGGYSLTEPAVRFPSTSNLKENILRIATQYSLVVYFDGDGQMRVKNLQGGLAGPTKNDATVATNAHFYKNPNNDDQYVIIGEKKKDSKYADVPSQIVVKTIDASMCLEQKGGIIIIGAKNPNPPLPFNRVLLNESPVFACLANAQIWLDDNKKRLFMPISGINIRTVGGFDIRPLDIISVDDEVYRVSNLSRTFNAEDNSMSADITGIWYGDNQL
jgi:hypothetical protein